MWTPDHYANHASAQFARKMEQLVGRLLKNTDPELFATLLQEVERMEQDKVDQAAKKMAKKLAAFRT